MAWMYTSSVMEPGEKWAPQLVGGLTLEIIIELVWCLYWELGKLDQFPLLIHLQGEFSFMSPRAMLRPPSVKQCSFSTL